MMMLRTLTLLSIVTVCSVTDLPAQQRAEFDPCRAVENSTLFKPLGEIRTQLFSDGKRMPPDCSSAFFGQQQGGSSTRQTTPKVFTWEPTNFAHMPAYFDDVPLERYGQTHHPYLQPGVSAAKFFLQIPAIPYKIGVNRPHECITTLGHQPPGNCLPCLKQTLPYEADATLLEVASVVGLVFLLP